MSNTKLNSLRIVSIIALLIAFVLFGMQVAGYFKKSNSGTSNIHLQLAVAAFIPILISLLFHRRSNYIISIVFSIISILIPKLYATFF
jgi:hypothetical protein